MNRYYIIVPLILMSVFVYFERDASKQALIVEEQKMEAKKVEEAKKEEEKRVLEEKAKIDSERRNEQRLKEEKEKEDKKKAEYQAKLQRFKDDIKRYSDDIDKFNKEVERLQKELADKRELRERENRATFELAKKVEISKKMRRNAELQLQRYTAMLAKRADESAMAKMPVVAEVKKE